jgi:hypothetical protein
MAGTMPLKSIPSLAANRHSHLLDVFTPAPLDMWPASSRKNALLRRKWLYPVQSKLCTPPGILG